jgi:hypothetical protein
MIAPVPPDTEHTTAKLARALIDGEFDATKAESDAWARSPDGQAAFAGLLKGRQP